MSSLTYMYIHDIEKKKILRTSERIETNLCIDLLTTNSLPWRQAQLLEVRCPLRKSISSCITCTVDKSPLDKWHTLQRRSI